MADCTQNPAVAINPSPEVFLLFVKKAREMQSKDTTTNDYLPFEDVHFGGVTFRRK